MLENSGLREPLAMGKDVTQHIEERDCLHHSEESARGVPTLISKAGSHLLVYILVLGN